MALLRFDPKRGNVFVEAGWPRKGSAEKNGIALRLVGKGRDGKMKLIRNLGMIPFNKSKLQLGVQFQAPQLGNMIVRYKKALGMFPLVTIILDGQTLKGSEVKTSPLGEISYVG